VLLGIISIGDVHKAMFRENLTHRGMLRSGRIVKNLIYGFLAQFLTPYRTDSVAGQDFSRMEEAESG
jgi:hypothetical protein